MHPVPSAPWTHSPQTPSQFSHPNFTAIEEHLHVAWQQCCQTRANVLTFSGRSVLKIPINFENCGCIRLFVLYLKSKLLIADKAIVKTQNQKAILKLSTLFLENIT